MKTKTRTRKKISKQALRQLFRWRTPKPTRKQFRRSYHGTFFNSILYTEPMYEIYTKEQNPEKVNTGCFKKKVVPYPLKKKQSYVWKISGGLFYWI